MRRSASARSAETTCSRGFACGTGAGAGFTEPVVGDEDLPERSPRLLVLLLPQRAGEGRSVDGAVVHEELAELLGSGSPGVDDATLVETDSSVELAGDEGERPGAAAEMDELQGVRYRIVVAIAG